MICRIKLFAAARQFSGCEEITLDLPERATVADLRAELVIVQPALASIVPSAMIAVNTQYARETEVIPAGAEVAVIPPVSGG